MFRAGETGLGADALLRLKIEAFNADFLSALSEKAGKKAYARLSDSFELNTYLASDPGEYEELQRKKNAKSSQVGGFDDQSNDDEFTKGP